MCGIFTPFSRTSGFGPEAECFFYFDGVGADFFICCNDGGKSSDGTGGSSTQQCPKCHGTGLCPLCGSTGGFPSRPNGHGIPCQTWCSYCSGLGIIA